MSEDGSAILGRNHKGGDYVGLSRRQGGTDVLPSSVPRHKIAAVKTKGTCGRVRVDSAPLWDKK